MRRLKSTDLFSAMRFVKEAELRQKVTEIAMKARANGGIIKEEELGADMIIGILESASEKKAERKFYEFLEGPFEMKADEIQELELLEFLDMFAKFKDVEDIEGWSRFFSLLANLMK